LWDTCPNCTCASDTCVCVYRGFMWDTCVCVCVYRGCVRMFLCKMHHFN